MLLADVVLVVMAVLTALLAALAVAGFLYATYALDESFGRSILETWARSADVELVRARRRRWRDKPPFRRYFPKHTLYYRVVVRTSGSRLRAGWVGCGHRIWGMLIAHADVVWDADDAKFPVDPAKGPVPAEAGPLWDREMDL